MHKNNNEEAAGTNELSAWWNWEMDDQGLYKGWDSKLVPFLAKLEIKLVWPLAPFLHNVSKLGKPDFKRNMYDEAFQRGCLVLRKGKVLERTFRQTQQLPFATVDLRKDFCRKWFADSVILPAAAVLTIPPLSSSSSSQKAFNNKGGGGWIAEFGEALPPLDSAKTSDLNVFPELWARTSEIAVSSLNLNLTKDANKYFFSLRSSGASSARHSFLDYVGDNMVTWVRYAFSFLRQ